MSGAHIAVNLALRNQRGYRVDNHNVNRAGTNQRFRNLKRLLAVVRLGDKQRINIYAECL
jgi:hypothetical protein